MLKTIKKFGAIVSILTVFSAPMIASAAISLDSITSGITHTAVTSLTVSHTVGAGSNKYLLVTVESSVTPSGAVFNGSQTMSQLYQFSNSPNLSGFTTLYGLANPNSVTGNVVVSLSSSDGRVSVVVYSLNGVKQTGQPNAANGANNPNSYNLYAYLTTSVGDWVFAHGVVNASTGSFSGMNTSLYDAYGTTHIAAYAGPYGAGSQGIDLVGQSGVASGFGAVALSQSVPPTDNGLTALIGAEF